MARDTAEAVVAAFEGKAASLRGLGELRLPLAAVGTGSNAVAAAAEARGVRVKWV